ncbi:putative SP-containing protein [Vairimorpha necatrix]|uniref:SP-containing protein n=1 Tax=Vairimorpha necatrix TaxID=6039 RepID=A0AAX4J9B2_9MICR
MYFLLISCLRCSELENMQSKTIIQNNYDLTRGEDANIKNNLILSFHAITIWNNSLEIFNTAKKDILRFKNFEFKRWSKKSKILDINVRELNALLDEDFIKDNSKVAAISVKLYKHFDKSIHLYDVKHLKMYEKAIKLISLHKIKIEKIYNICKDMEFDSNLKVYKNIDTAKNWKNFVEQVKRYKILQDFEVVLYGLEHIKNTINKNVKECADVLEH